MFRSSLWASCILIGCLLTAETTGFRLDFDSIPNTLSPPFTKELKIRCSLKNTGAATAKMSGVQDDQPVSQEHLKHVISIVVTHQGGHVATVSQFEPARGLVDGNQLFVTGSVRDVTDAYLELTWQSPNSNQAGNYTCEMNAVNEFSHTVILTKTVAVGVSNLTLERLAQVVEQQDKTISQLDNTIQTLQTTITQLETIIQNLQTTVNQSSNSPHLETGYGHCGNSNFWSTMSTNSSVLYKDIRIDFTKPYDHLPNVNTALSRIETTSSTQGLGVSVSWYIINKTYAIIRCTAENTHVKDMVFLWISL